MGCLIPTRGAAAIFLAFLAVHVHAATISATLGDQDFTHGSIVSPATFAEASVNEPIPFQSLRGGDATGHFNETFTFHYDAVADPIVSATLQIGTYELESLASGNQIALFSLLGSSDLTALINAAAEGSPGDIAQVKVYTISIPSSGFAALSSGVASFQMTTQGPGRGMAGQQYYNAVGLDFATLMILTGSQEYTRYYAPIGGLENPEPSTISLLFLGLLAGVLYLRFRARASS